MGASSRSSRNESLSPVARTLLGLLRPADGSGAAEPAVLTFPQAWDGILDLALRQGVAPLLHRALQTRGGLSDVPDLIRASLEEARRATALGNLWNYGEFQRIARALRARGIPVIPLKGLHLADLVYRDISLRPMSDLDILVPRSWLGQATAILRELDYGFDADLSGAAEAMLDTKCNIGFEHRDSGTWLEVHWSLDEPPERCAAVVEEIWRGAVPGRVGDAEALIMPTEFLLLHVGAHLACNHAFAFSLRALCDIAEIVRRYPALDWGVVVDHGRRHAWKRGVAAALWLAHKHFGVAVPEDVLDALGAGALDLGLLAEAMEHLLACADMPQALRTAPNVIAAAGSGEPLSALVLVWNRVFVPRAELALLYGVPERSAQLPLFYALRLRDLLRRYAASAWALKFSDPALAASAARHARLVHWINSP